MKEPKTRAFSSPEDFNLYQRMPVYMYDSEKKMVKLHK